MLSTWLLFVAITFFLWLPIVLKLEVNLTYLIHNTKVEV
jgi:hypothetical protein